MLLILLTPCAQATAPSINTHLALAGTPKPPSATPKSLCASRAPRSFNMFLNQSTRATQPSLRTTLLCHAPSHEHALRQSCTCLCTHCANALAAAPPCQTQQPQAVTPRHPLPLLQYHPRQLHFRGVKQRQIRLPTQTCKALTRQTDTNKTNTNAKQSHCTAPACRVRALATTDVPSSSALHADFANTPRQCDQANKTKTIKQTLRLTKRTIEQRNRIHEEVNTTSPKQTDSTPKA